MFLLLSFEIFKYILDTSMCAYIYTHTYIYKYLYTYILIYLYIISIYINKLCNYFLPIWDLHLISFWRTVLNYNEVIYHFYFMNHATGNIKKSWAETHEDWILSLTFLSRCFIILGITLWSIYILNYLLYMIHDLNKVSVNVFFLPYFYHVDF